MQSDIDSLEVGGGFEVSESDEFRVIEENSALLGTASVGETLTVTGFRESPSGPEIVVESDSGRTRCLSPTTVGEALGVAKYPPAPDSACLEEV